jgi:hypothetical protein
LEVHPTYGEQGGYFAEATPESCTLLHSALAENRSQFRYLHPDEADEAYVQVSSNLALHHEEYDEIAYYPIETDATYTYVHIGNLAVAQAGLITL